MKIGIVTFAETINYGTALQAVALKKTLDSFHGDAAFIPHRCSAIDSASKVFDLSCAASPAYTLAHLVNLPAALQRKRAFQRFWAEHFTFGEEDPAAYDIVVAGSDQVWNYQLTGCDWYYYLDFPKGATKKVAYAASFGLPEVAPEYADTLRPLLQDFDALSVREKTGAQIVADISGRDVPVVLDPTLLLNREQWQALSDPAMTQTGYIFVYTVFNSERLWEFAYDLSKRTGLPIKTVSYSKLHKHRAEYSFTAGPAQWLSYMGNASYVVTNSFHGFAFSVNFQKQFYYELPPAKSGVGSRLSDMAQAYGLSHREIGQADGTEIDYAPVLSSLERDRRRSMDFLAGFLSPNQNVR